MKEIKNYGLQNLTLASKLKINGGHPIIVGLGAISSILAIGMAVDRATEWFIDGWNNPK